MPSLNDAINADRSNLTRIDPSEQPKEIKPPAAPPTDSRVNSLLKSPYARCPLPPSNNSADSLRQWGQGGDVPKFRTQTPPSNTAVGGGGSSGSVSETSSSGVAPAPLPVLPTAQTVGVSTPPLAPGQKWTGTVQMAKAFIVLSVSVNAQARVELYGTKNGQTLDLSRPITTPPANTTPSIIMDVVLQSLLTWKVLDCVGANGDPTQSATIYVTVTNLSNAVRAITASLQYVPQQS